METKSDISIKQEPGKDKIIAKPPLASSTTQETSLKQTNENNRTQRSFRINTFKKGDKNATGESSPTKVIVARPANQNLQRRNTNDQFILSKNEKSQEKIELADDSDSSPFKHFRKRLKPMQASMTMNECEDIKEKGSSQNSGNNKEILLKTNNSKTSLQEDS